MKKFYLPLRKVFFACSLLFASVQGKAQFTTAGDIAFTGYIAAAASGDESFSFVLLKNIPAGSTLNFTDRGWNGTAFNATTESLLTWVTGSALVAGREITISGAALSTTMTAVVSGSNISAGTVTGTMVSLATSGDQVLAYVGTVASPTFIAGIHMNSYNNGNGGSECGSTSVAGWDPPACANPGNANSSALPAGLTAGTHAVYIGFDNTFNSDVDNARFACAGALATPAQVRATVSTYNGTNWTTANGAPPFNLPSGCAYLASIFPSRLISFTARNIGSAIALNWQTDNEQDMLHYEVERSYDGRQFTSIKTLQALRGSLVNNYVYNDAEALRSNYSTVYYRIKFVDRAAEIFYTDIKTVKLDNNGGIMVENMVNPFSGSLEFNLINNSAQQVTLRVTGMSGQTLLRQTRNLAAGVSHITLAGTEALPRGIYTLEISATNSSKRTFKLVKNDQ